MQRELAIEPGDERRSVWKVEHIIPSIANFNIQYNFASASVAVAIINSTSNLGHALYPEPAWSKDLELATVFIGAILGMLVMGRLGDTVGRTKAMRFTTCLVILGAAIPAAAIGSPNVVYAIIACGRLVLGVGVGGAYPLSATSAAEQSHDRGSRSSVVSWAFLWQVPGQIIPYVLALGLFSAFGTTAWVEQASFRILFALGTLPGILVLLAGRTATDSDEFLRDAQQSQVGIIQILRRESPQLRKTLLGTAGSWFLYDISFYGIAIFSPTILANICLAGVKAADGSCQQTLQQVFLQNIFVQVMGLPAILISVLLIDRTGSKRLNVIGFLCLFVSFAAMGVAYMMSLSPRILFGLLCCITFFINFGPSLATYVLPAICFPAHLRSTCHGISSCGGKLGAVVGTVMFPFINTWSLGAVLFIQSACSLAGAILSQALLDHDWNYLKPEPGEATRNLRDTTL